MDVSAALRSILFVKPANFTGIPGITVPIGYHKDLPIGFQLMGSWWNEEKLIEIAKLIETEHTYVKPQVFVDNLE